MSGRELTGHTQRSGRGSNVSGTSRGRSRGRVRVSKSRSESTVLPVSHTGRVLTSNPAVIDWLTRSSTSSQVTSDTHSQQSMGSSDTTLTWHGPGAGTAPSRVLKMPLAFASPSPREVLHAVCSPPLYSDDEDLTECSQQLLPSQEQEETSAVSLARQPSSEEESGVAAVAQTDQAPGPDSIEDDISELQRLLEDDDEESDRTWDPGAHGASSSTSGEEGASLPVSKKVDVLARRQQGGSSVRVSKRSRGRAADSQQPPSTGSIGAVVRAGSSTQSVRPVGGKITYSAVWEFFVKPPDEVNVAMCRICGQKVKRGQGSNVGTTALRQHMQRHHTVAWENRGSDRVIPTSAATTPSPNVTHTVSASQGSTTSADGSSFSLPSSAVNDATSPRPNPRHAFYQQSITEAIAKRQQYACTHPKALKMNVLLSKLLVLQSLPFQLVDSSPFREMMACAEPRWKVPSRHFFSKKAVPSLHKHVEEKVGESLNMSVSAKVHCSADVWSCNYGQGQYMSLTAHWVNLLPSQAQQQLGQVTPLLPPRCHALGPATMAASASSSSTVSSPSTPGTSTSARPAYHMCRAQRCHAVLHLVCLGERSHTGEELLRVMHQEIDTWLSPRQLKIGTMLTDNGRNMVSALRQGRLSHAPCMAHVFNLVVKRFLKCSTDLQDILKMSRKLCMHFSHSYTAKHTLLELQRQNGIPQHRMICDVSTRWNSTLHMLDRLYEQRKAITDFLMFQAERSTPLCNFDVSQWQLMRDTCRLLRPFEEATLFVSRQDYGMNDVIPLLHVLEQMLVTMAGQATGDVAPRSHCRLSPVGAELDEEDEAEEDMTVPDMFCEMGGYSTQLTGEEEQEHSPEHQGEEEEEETEDPDTPWQYSVDMEAGTPSQSLAHMAHSMLTCLRSDSRIVTIRQRDDYWLSTLLDPRYRCKMGSFFSPAEREVKLKYYRNFLCSQLASAYLRHRPSTRRLGHVRSRYPGMATGEVWSGRSSIISSSSSSNCLSLQSMMSSFIHPESAETQQQQRQVDREQDLKQQVVAYLDCTLPTHIENPLDYWASKLDMWPQLAEFALERLSCPASSVASERVFSAAGAFVTPRRTRLSTKNLERMTFVKMNQAWISKDFNPPVPDVTD